MSSNSNIEWCDDTWNPLAGCTAKSAGCLNCYAAVMTNRLGAMGQEKYKGLTVLRNGHRMFNGTMRLDEEALTIPLRRKKPTIYFVNSMSDLFWGDADDLKSAHAMGTKEPKPVPFEFIDKVFAVMALCPQHTFQVLTKRPERMAEYLNTPFVCNRIVEAMQIVDPKRGVWVWPGMTDAFHSIWLGTSCENQKAADERIPHLRRCPAAVRFISQEPQLEDITYRDEWSRDLHWIIQGGESGHGARRFDVQWARKTRDWCKGNKVAYFLKQLGAKPIDSNCQDILCNGKVHYVRPAGHKDCVDALKRPGYTVADHDMSRLLQDNKGGEISEWPEDLRIRQMPGM